MSLTVGKIGGIPIALDYSWFIIFFLFAWTIGFDFMPAAYPGLSLFEYGVIGFVSSILLFVSVLIHELAHSIIAKRSGMKIARISLFLLGGVSEMEEEPDNPGLELKMSAAGPLTSAALAVILWVLWLASVSIRAPVLIRAPIQYSALINVTVAAFNMIPAFPMDGGRVLRSLLWRRNNDPVASTRQAANVGRGIAYAMMFGGIFFIFFVDLATGLWLILIGWFITSGARSSMVQAAIQEDLKGLRARDLMTRGVDSLSPDLTIEEASQEFTRLKHNGFPVTEGGAILGCITTDDLRKVDKKSWNTVRVRDVMIPREKLVTMKEADPALNAVNLMNRNRIGRIFVLDDAGGISGIITRSDILRTVQMKGGVLATEKEYAGHGKSFTVDRGMFFVLDQPAESGGDWRAEFNPAEFRLVDTRTSHGEAGETRTFTFEALSSGSHEIRLVLEKQKPGVQPQPVLVATRIVKYSIIVKGSFR